jgi:hypothetical protein
MLGSQTIARYDPRAPGSRWHFQNVGVDCYGIAADGAGWVWAAGYAAGVVRLDGDDPSRFFVVPGTGRRGSKGMAVDFARRDPISGDAAPGNDPRAMLPGRVRARSANGMRGMLPARVQG